MKTASFSIRLVALLIDCILLAILEKILPVNLLYYEILPESYESSFFETLSNFEFLILAPIYFVGFRYWNKGQTLGKKVFGIKTVSKDGKKLSFFQSILDCLGYYLLPIDVIVGALVSTRRQRLTQACAGTIVVEEYP